MEDHMAVPSTSEHELTVGVGAPGEASGDIMDLEEGQDDEEAEDDTEV